MSTPNILLLAAVACLILAPALFFGRKFVNNRPRPGGYRSHYDCTDRSFLAWDRSCDRRRTIRQGLWITGLLVLPVIALVLGCVILVGGRYFAGQGDALDTAHAWTAKWRPGATVECQTLDTDGNGYVSCTVGTPDGEIDAIECGVNRWYNGWRTTGCRLMKGYSGSQP
jgi:hypothetical protein